MQESHLAGCPGLLWPRAGRRPGCPNCCPVVAPIGHALGSSQLCLQVLDGGSAHLCCWGQFLLGAPGRPCPWLSRLLRASGPTLHPEPAACCRPGLQSAALLQGPRGTPGPLGHPGFPRAHLEGILPTACPPASLPYTLNTAKTKSPTETSLMTKCCPRGGLPPTLAREPGGGCRGGKVHLVPKESKRHSGRGQGPEVCGREVHSATSARARQASRVRTPARSAALSSLM